MKRLYVLIDQKLDAVYGCVQGGHAVAQWLLEHPNQEWNNSYLIYLYADLDKWKVRLDLVNKDYSSFYEPDLGNQLTAIALQDDHVVITKNPNPHLTTLEDLKDLNKRYLYREGQKILTPFGIETIKEIIRTHSKQRGYEWLILVEENGNQYTPFELNGIVVKELTLEQWNQIIE